MSVFEIFMQLPLFKGIDKEEMFSLIPKINLDFETFQPGEVVFDRQMDPGGLIYLLKGKVKTRSINREEEISGPVLLSYTGLFGSNRHYSADVTALDICNTLNVETKSLLFLLRNCPAFMMNYLDLLSDTIDKLSLENETEI